MRGTQKDPTKLKLSFDRKVSNEGWWYAKRKFWVAKTPNSFGLPSGDSCPGRTEFCDSCYGTNCETHMPDVRFVLEHNLNLLTSAGSVEAMSELLMEMVGRYWRWAERKAYPAEDRIFRIHWDGDFFSEDYAWAWRIVIANYPGIKFWTYTRSFGSPVNVVPMLAGLPNLKLYLSVDQWNLYAAGEMLRAYPDVLVAGCAEDYRRAREMVPPERIRVAVICPENSGRIELNAKGVGACVTCKLCPDGRRDILFSTSHRENIEVQLVLMPTSRGKCACGCGRWLPPQSGPGRRRKYFEESCRWKVYRQNKAAGKEPGTYNRTSNH